MASLVMRAHSPAAGALRRYSISHNDAYWSRRVSFIDSYSEAVSTGVGGPITGGSFRRLGYHLPAHRVCGVGWDRFAPFGYLFETRNRRSNDSGHRPSEPAGRLTIPEDVGILLIPDVGVAHLIDLSTVESDRWNLQGGASVTVIHISEGSVPELGSIGDQAHIRRRSRFALDEGANDGAGGAGGSVGLRPGPHVGRRDR